MKNKYLVIVENLEDIKRLKEKGINKFLFPLEGFSVGFNRYYKITEIKEENAYLFINRILTSDDLDKLKIVLSNNSFKGIVFDDLGVIEVLKDIETKKILYSNHFLTNSESVKHFLEYVDSVVVSSDLTLQEVNHIIKTSPKKVSILGYGHLNIFYSRRLLNTNYAKYHNLEEKNILNLENTDYKFISNQNEYGTVIYDSEITNGLNEEYYDNLEHIIINLTNCDIETFLQNKNDGYKGFLNNKTIYKLKGDK